MFKKACQLFLTLGIFGLLSSCSVIPALAQGRVFTIPQTNQTTLGTAIACTGSAQNYVVQNIGQTQHTATLIATGTLGTLSMEIDGFDNNGNSYRMSDVALGNFGTTGQAITASGYFPKVQVSVTCTGGATYTLSYTGFSSTPPINSGVLLGSQIDKLLFYSQAANAGAQSTFQTPYGNSSGTIVFNYNTGAIANSTITLECESLITGAVTQQYIFTMANTTNGQTFVIPPGSCPFAAVVYSNGGAGGTFTLEYFFNQPGAQVNATLGSYRHITATTATIVKSIGGTVLNLVIGTPAAGTVSFFDLGSAACTGTPATNVVSVITPNATDPPNTIPFNHLFVNGICVKASAVMDLTVGFQ